MIFSANALQSTRQSGSASTLDVQNRAASGDDRESYLQFDLSQLDARTRVDSASVVLHVTATSGRATNQAAPVLDVG